MIGNELKKERRKGKGRVGLPKKNSFITNVKCHPRLKTDIACLARNLTLPAGQLKVGRSAITPKAHDECTDFGSKNYLMTVTELNFLGKLSSCFQVIILYILNINKVGFEA